MGIRHSMVHDPRQIMTVIYCDNMYKTRQHHIDFSSLWIEQGVGGEPLLLLL